jgi:uncharacterized protein (TIGR02058 family)
MPLQRCLLELGTGVDLHGEDSTKAARRAVFDALRHSSVSFPRVFGYDIERMSVEVNIAVPDPSTVIPEDVLKEIPYGRKTIQILEGGMKIPGPNSTVGSTVVANAAIIVSLDIKEDR